jgi:hypothetical protein
MTRLLRCVRSSVTLDRVSTAQQLITMVTNLFKKAQNNGHLFIIHELSPAIALWLGESKNTGIEFTVTLLINQMCFLGSRR